MLSRSREWLCSPLFLEVIPQWHSGYFPWNHGKFICKGEGKWSCTGLRSYRSYGSEAMGWPYEQARRPPHRFRPTPLVASLSMIFHLLIGEVWTIRNETTYPIHGKYPLNRILRSFLSIRPRVFWSWRVYVGFYIFPALLRLYSVGVTP